MNEPKFRFLFSAIVALAMAPIAMAHPGGINTPNPNLPPAGVYLTPTDVHAMYTGADLAIVLTAVQHQPFVPGDKTNNGPDEHHHFNSLLTAEATCQDVMSGACALNGLPPGVPVIATFQGPVSTVAHLKPPGTITGLFPTEMLSMDLQGFGGMVRIRESPTLPSLGSTSITDIGGGMYHIDSFFDVFTELSLDGGATWRPSAGPSHVILGIPEPTSIVLIGLALIGLIGIPRRRS